MVRTVITPSDIDVHLTIAREYVGRPIEITYLALDEIENEDAPKPRKTMADFWKSISEETGNKLHENIDKMRNEWERDV